MMKNFFFTKDPTFWSELHLKAKAKEKSIRENLLILDQIQMTTPNL